MSNAYFHNNITLTTRRRSYIGQKSIVYVRCCCWRFVQNDDQVSKKVNIYNNDKKTHAKH